jgi:hypothetical protein
MRGRRGGRGRLVTAVVVLGLADGSSLDYTINQPVTIQGVSIP